jgi:SAM-dependent methyltransferase
VIALGLIPWLHSPADALAEMARVLQPGGFLLMSSDNRLRLSHLLDPLQLPFLNPLKSLVRRIARALGHDRPRSLASLVTYGTLARLLSSVGFVPLRRQTFGFGPFTAFRRPLLSDAAGMRLHLRLQALADRGVPLLRATGAQDLVLAQRT